MNHSPLLGHVVDWYDRHHGGRSGMVAAVVYDHGTGPSEGRFGFRILVMADDNGELCDLDVLGDKPKWRFPGQ